MNILIIIACMLMGFLSCTSSGGSATVTRVSELADNLGRVVTVTGKKSDMPWQHMIDDSEEYPVITYFDVGHDQTVLYSKTPIDCPGAVTVTGEPITVSGTTKNPRSDAVYREHQLIVHSWVCARSN